MFLLPAVRGCGKPGTRKRLIFSRHRQFGCSYAELQQLNPGCCAGAGAAWLWKTTQFRWAEVGARKGPLQHLQICGVQKTRWEMMSRIPTASPSRGICSSMGGLAGEWEYYFYYCFKAHIKSEIVQGLLPTKTKTFTI